MATPARSGQGPSTSCTDGRATRRVAGGEGRFEPSEEIDAIRWVPLDRAGRDLTRQHDRGLLREVTDDDADQLDRQGGRS